MSRTSLSLGLVIVLLTVASAALYATGCGTSTTNITCPTRYHPDHVDEIGGPDPCCFSINPCCPNPFWGRMVTEPNGFYVNDNCCLSVPCPGWDPWKGADASSNSTMSDGAEPDASTEPDAGAEPDAGP
jgi:hypothetical protein